MTYAELNGKTIREGFKEFDKANPHVYREFEKQAIIAIQKGRKKISAKMLVNWIRWNEFLRTSDENFKINDAYHSYYSRLFIEKHPEYDGVFELRKLRNEVPGAYMEVDENGQISFL